MSFFAEEKRPGLVFPFIMGTLPWVITLWSVTLVGELFGKRSDIGFVFIVSFAGLLGGVVNALYTRKTGHDDRALQQNRVRNYAIWLTISSFIVQIVLPKTTPVLATDPSIRITLVLGLFVHTVFLVSIRMIHRRNKPETA